MKHEKMASNEQLVDDDGALHDGDTDAQGKRRRVQRACDVCRKKKIRCDGLQPDKGACTNCASYGHQCTFVDATKRRAPPRSYVIALEARMERAERLIVQLLPNVELDKAIGPMPELPNESRKEGEDGEEGGFAQQPSSSNNRSDFVAMQQRKDASDLSKCSTGWDACGRDEYRHEERGEDGSEDEGEDAAFVRIQLGNVSLNSEPNTMIAAFRNSRGSQVYDLRDFEQEELDQKINEKGSQEPLLYYGHASGVHLFPALHRLARSEDDSTSFATRSPSTSSATGPSLETAGLPSEPDVDWSAIKFR